MGQASLIAWKERVYHYQQSIRQQSAPEQTSLFDLTPSAWHNPDEIDPFTLPAHSPLFWRQADRLDALDNSHQGCLYFILDRHCSLLLYIGETKLSANQRWQGHHDCKDYILSYIELHRRYDLPVAVTSAFWLHVPPQKKILRQWERELILKWRSPFNKECWQFWGQPFGKPPG